jgi:hypothetical protein
MTVSFNLYKANGQRFELLPGDGDREISLSEANACDVLAALGIEVAYSASPWPLQCFRSLLTVARRKRLDHASPAIPVWESQEPGQLRMVDCGRAEGYIERKLALLSTLANEGAEIGATHIGWG